MPDPSIPQIAIQSHAAALQGAVERHGANATRCKMWSGAGVAGMILLGVGHGPSAGLPWAAGMVGLLALWDACNVAMGRRAVGAYSRFMARVPLNGGNLPKAEEWLVLPGADLGIRDLGCVIRALGSLTVWPFYGALLSLLVAFYLQGPIGGEAGPQSAVRNPKSAMPAASQPVSVSKAPPSAIRPATPPPVSPFKPVAPPSGVRIPGVGGAQPVQPVQPVRSGQPGPIGQPGQPVQPGVRVMPNGPPPNPQGAKISPPSSPANAVSPSTAPAGPAPAPNGLPSSGDKSKPPEP